jgi:hypothetical protein
MTKIAGSGSISQRHGSADPDPDPPQNVMDPQHCIRLPDLIADEKRRRTLAVGAILSYLGPSDLTKIADGKEVGLLRRWF